jgi:hypothetical protein
MIRDITDSRRVICDEVPNYPAFPTYEESTVALVATLAPFPRSRRILGWLFRHAEGLGYEVLARLVVSEGDLEVVELEE